MNQPWRLAWQLALPLMVCATLASAQVKPWPSDSKLSGNAFLPPGLLALQADSVNNPITLWLDKGLAIWADASAGPSCQSCHGAAESLKNAAPTHPKLSANGQSLVNLEDQILQCRSRSGHTGEKLEDDAVLALSALLHSAAKGQPIQVQAAPGQAAQWQARLSHGTQLFATRMGRINLACVQCHEQNVGQQMRADVISPGQPTGFPIYRMSWQKLGSMDRRLRACYSGVQAVIPPAGASDLRDLELFLKVRANGLVLDGPSIRR